MLTLSVLKVIKMKGLLLFCFILFFVIGLANLSDASRLSQSMNSNIIFKSIKSQDGDVIDCVDISRQPAFDHPLLKDHIIKMMPSYHPERKQLSDEFESNGNRNEINQIWQLSGDCPEGTIPIRRTDKKREISNLKKHKRNNNSKPRLLSSAISTDAVESPIHQYAITAIPNGEYYGTQATISVYQPQVEGGDEFSLSQLWVAAGSDSNTNTIEVGWIVYPAFFGDNQTRLFIYWTSDNYGSTGCWNLLCSGFVQINNQMAIGGSIFTAPGNRPEITLLVWKDEGQHVWWLQYNGTVLGYWPTAIFTVLNGTSSFVEWGGEIINDRTNGRQTATQMGSGLFAQAGPGRASHFRNIYVVNNANTLIPAPGIAGYAADPTCYNVSVGSNSDWGDFFYYGGPGRNPNCP